MFTALWSYRDFVLASVRRDLEARYRVSVLGGVWAILNPLAQIAIYTLVLSGVMRARLPGVESTFAYSTFLCAGIITWGVFAEIISRCTSIFVENASLLKKLSFPRICLPAIVVGSALTNFAIALALFLLFLLAIGHIPGVLLLALIPVFAIQITLAVGLGVLFGVAHVFFRDTGQGVGILLQFWFWLTPIVYPLEVVPPQFQSLIRANPMTGLAEAYQAIFLAHRWPDWPGLLPAGVISVVVALFGLSFFRKRAVEMVDEL